MKKNGISIVVTIGLILSMLTTSASHAKNRTVTINWRIEGRKNHDKNKIHSYDLKIIKKSGLLLRRHLQEKNGAYEIEINLRKEEVEYQYVKKILKMLPKKVFFKKSLFYRHISVTLADSLIERCETLLYSNDSENIKAVVIEKAILIAQDLLKTATFLEIPKFKTLFDFLKQELEERLDDLIYAEEEYT